MTPDLSKSVLIVGLGQIGMGYDLHLDSNLHVYSHARAFSLHPEFHLLAAVEPDEKKQEVFTQTYQTPVYSDLDTALSEHQPELIVIATTTQSHAEVLYKILNISNPEIILCEKPLSYELNDARKMVQLCHDKGVGLYVNYMRISDPGVIKVKSLIESDVIQTPVKGVAWYSKGFFHNGSHFFNLLEYWLGSMKSFNLLDRGRLWNEIDPEPDVKVEFEKGIVVFLAAWEEAFSHYTIELLSPSGRIRFEQEGALIQWQSVQDDPVFKGYSVLNSQPEQIESNMTHFQLNVADQLTKVLDGQEAHLCSGVDALRTIENMNLILH